MVFYQNKIILIEIKELISSLKHQNKFVNKLFDPLKKENSETFLEEAVGYIGKNTTHFMHGNYSLQKNKNCLNYNQLIRRNKDMLNNFAKQLQDSAIFSKMIDSVKNIVDIGILNADHEVFKLIEKDRNAMPENFVKSVNTCIYQGKFDVALLFLIMWSIYGECIEKLAPVYEKVLKNPLPKLSERKNISVKLLTNTKPCRPIVI